MSLVKRPIMKVLTRAFPFQFGNLFCLDSHLSSGTHWTWGSPMTFFLISFFSFSMCLSICRGALLRGFDLHFQIPEAGAVPARGASAGPRGRASKSAMAWALGGFPAPNGRPGRPFFGRRRKGFSGVKGRSKGKSCFFRHPQSKAPPKWQRIRSGLFEGEFVCRWPPAAFGRANKPSQRCSGTWPRSRAP